MGDYRPGIDALHRNGIRSPLLEVKFTKENVRKIAKNVGLSIYDKPSILVLLQEFLGGKE